MSEIVFDATLNTGKLEANVKKSSQSIQEWAKGVENAGVRADKSFDKLADTIKTQVSQPFEREIKKEEGLIASLERSLETLRERKKRAFTIEEIEKYNKKIQEAEFYLKEYNTAGRVAVENNENQEKSHNAIIASLGKWAAGILTVTGGVKLFKGIMESTQRTAEEFHATMNGAKTGLDYFMKSVANAGNGGFDNFIKGLRNAISAGKEYSREQSRIANIRNEYAIKTADLDREIEEQRRIFYEDDKTSIDAKLTAADKMLENMKKKSDLEIDLAVKTYNNEADLAKKKNKLSEEDIRYAIENYQRVEEIGNAYNRLKKVVDEYGWAVKHNLTNGPEGSAFIAPFANGPTMQVTREEIEGYKQQMINLDPDAAKMGLIFAGLEKLNERERKAITDGIVNVKEAENQYLIESKRVFRMKENMVDQETKTEKDFWDAYYKWFFDQLEKQSAALKKMKEDNLKVAETFSKVDPGKGYSILERSITNTGGKPAPWNPADRYKSLFSGSDRWAKEMQTAIEKNDKEQIDKLSKELDLRQKITESAADLVFQLGRVLGLSEEDQAALAGTLTAVTQFLSGNPIVAAITMLSAIMESFPKQTEKFAKEIERLNSVLEKSSRLGGAESALMQKLELLKKQEAEAEAGLKRLSLESLEKRIENLQGIRKEIEDTEQSLNDYLAGEVTENTLADSIAQAFEEGKTSAADFAAYMNDVLKEAVLNVFKSEILGPEMTDLTLYIKDALKDKILTSQEKSEIDRRTKEIADNNKQLWDNLTGSLDLGGGPGAGLTGGIARQITEDTGSELAGLFRRFADDSRAIKDYNKMGVDHLINIERNTFNTVEELKSAVAELKAINTNTKPAYAGEL